MRSRAKGSTSHTSSGTSRTRPFEMALNILCVSSPLTESTQGCASVRTMYKRTPIAQQSQATPYILPRPAMITSGATKYFEPSCSVDQWSISSPGLRILAKPKSITLVTRRIPGSFCSKQFSNLRSRWEMPRSWQCATAMTRSRNRSLISAMSLMPWFKSLKLPPEQSSVTTCNMSASSKNSKNFTMLGWSRLTNASSSE
mmetsp:Transcript_90462/g.255350  ORF Transcript_90462/g.255350 Transcript_90462/m.255350 type:complete len:200 (-) Transcript_90462:323-922(-)